MCSNSQKTTSIARPSCSHFAKRAQCEFQKKRDFVSGHQTRSLNFPMLLEHPHAFHAFLRFKSFWEALNTPMSRVEKLRDIFGSNYTPRAQQVLVQARQEANRLNHNFVGTEHVLLGILKLGQGTAVQVLEGMGMDLESLRQDVARDVGVGPEQKIIGCIPY